MQQLVMLSVELMFTTRLVHIDTWRRYVDIDNFSQTMALLMERHQGLIMLTGHYGNWEILGYVLATLGFETSTVTPRSTIRMSVNMSWVCARQGQRLVYKKGATSGLTDALDDHGVVCMVADQDAGSKGIFVDFFGRKASAYKSIGLLAMQYNVPVVVGYAPAEWANSPFPRGDPGHHLAQGMERAARPTPLYHAALHDGNRGFRPRRPDAIPLDPPPMEKPAQGRTPSLRCNRLDRSFRVAAVDLYRRRIEPRSGKWPWTHRNRRRKRA